MNAAADSKNALPKFSFSISSSYRNDEKRIQEKNPVVINKKISDRVNFFVETYLVK